MTEDLLINLNRFKKTKVLVIGDVMLDHYIWGEVSRISPEAPVQVVKILKETYLLGGAGNVASNIKTLGGESLLIGVIGEDNWGKIFKDKLQEEDISTCNLITINHKPTIRKTRIMGGKQQLLRLDYEKEKKFDPELETKIKKIIQNNLHQVDAVIISDYGKGAITKNIAELITNLCIRAKKPVLADPKPVHKDFYKKVTLITPNIKEAVQMANVEKEATLEEISSRLIHDLDTNILITKGAEGMSLYQKNGQFFHTPADLREVYDVTGAGDTVIATCALCLACDFNLKETVFLANKAASVAVNKLGTARVSLEELKDKIKEKQSKIKSLEEMLKIVKRLKEKNKKIIFTNGCFDIFHIGHKRFLEEAKKLGDILIIGLNSDDSVRRLKGKKRPIIPQKERAEILSSLDFVDYIVFFSEDLPLNLISKIKPDIHVKGQDYRLKDLPESQLIHSYGGKIVLIPEVKDRSSTLIINRILENYGTKSRIFK